MSTGPRDPKLEPRFGDVFRFGGSAGATTVLYIRPGDTGMGDDWMGLSLDSDFGFDSRVHQWVGLDAAAWQFVETIAVHAIGGVMPPTDFSGMSYKDVLRAIYGTYARPIRIDEVDS